MVSLSFKITLLGAAAIALLALSHVEAAPEEVPTLPTLEEIRARDAEFMKRAVKPAQEYYQCRSDCYNAALKSTLGKNFWGVISKEDKVKYAAEVARVDICVKDEIRKFTSFDKIDEYERKKRLYQTTVSQYCVDEVINKGKGLFDGIAKVPAHRVLEVQAKLAACSLDKCDFQYVGALNEVAKSLHEAPI
ncbi:hypothetical protein CPC16_004371 [Podila verticillata]|nr:hypothetical protein CPC16_004371 [Podila verticillata]KAI9240522.1 MAG: hypothetical protein BYD32DRAFT_408357 [Podila humilis]